MFEYTRTHKTSFFSSDSNFLLDFFSSFSFFSCCTINSEEEEGKKYTQDNIGSLLFFFLLFARASSLVCWLALAFVCPPLSLSIVRPSAKINSIGNENSVNVFVFLRSIFKIVTTTRGTKKVRIFGKSQHNSFLLFARSLPFLSRYCSVELVLSTSFFGIFFLQKLSARYFCCFVPRQNKAANELFFSLLFVRSSFGDGIDRERVKRMKTPYATHTIHPRFQLKHFCVRFFLLLLFVAKRILVSAFFVVGFLLLLLSSALP